MARDGDTRLRLLVISLLISSRRDEGMEIWEQIAGIVEANVDDRLEILVTDGRMVYKPRVEQRQMRLEPHASLTSTWRRGVDIVHVHHLLPLLPHLFLAALFRARGARIVFSPMLFLTDLFAGRSWTYRRSRLWTAFKGLTHPLLRIVWNWLAHTFICQSEQEMRFSHLPEDKCVVIHWPKPDVPLLEQAGPLRPPAMRPADAPIAFVSRMDPWRKGLDRLCVWLNEHRDELPRPAVVLLVPRGEGEPPELQQLVRDGLIEWDTESRGAMLREPLDRCRGAMLLSRFDGQPRSLREALWLGLPVICTSECGMNEVVRTLDAGLVVQGDNTADIQAAFEALGRQTVDTERMRRLLDRAETGSFLLSVLIAIGDGREPPHAYDYRSAAISAGGLAHSH